MQKLIICAFMLLASSNAVNAASIQFIQDGWESGGTLQVSFTGADADGDGSLIRAELAAFEASWATPAGDATRWGLSDIEVDGFIFSGLDNYLLFVRNADFFLVDSAFEGEALASLFDVSLFAVDSTSNPPSSVPEPAGLAVMGLITLAFGEVIRRRRV
jgi:hypothetical protein